MKRAARAKPSQKEAYPGALLYLLSGDGIRRVSYRETEHFQVLSGFLSDPERYLHHPLRVPDGASEA